MIDKAIEAELPEAGRRMGAIMEGKNPDTGELLERHDLDTLRPGELVAVQLMGLVVKGTNPSDEVRKLLHAYGQALVKPRFLMKPDNQPSCQEILDEIAPAAAPLGGFRIYDLAVLEGIRQISLSKYPPPKSSDPDFGPIAWGTLLNCSYFSFPIPQWVVTYFAEAAVKILAGLRPGNGRTEYQEAERVGRILGFGNRGRRSISSREKQYQRDWDIFMKVNEKRHSGEKKWRAYELVRDDTGLKLATIVRAYGRMSKQWAAPKRDAAADS